VGATIRSDSYEKISKVNSENRRIKRKQLRRELKDIKDKMNWNMELSLDEDFLEDSLYEE